MKYEAIPSHQESPARVVRVDELRRRLGFKSRTSIYRYERAGLLPPRRVFGPGLSGWLASEIESWLNTRPAA